MKLLRRWKVLGRCALSAVAAFWIATAESVAAQVAPCGDTEEVTPWMSGDVGMYAGGATQAPSSASIRLCSAAVGLDDRADQYRFGTQQMPGDFHLQALLTELDLGGAGGLIAVGPMTDWRAARIAIEARATGTGAVSVRASIRRGQGGLAEAWTDAVTTALPALLRIRRVDNMMRAELEDTDGLHLLLTTDVANTALAGLVAAGVYQASLDSAFHRQAVFSRFNVSAAPAPPGIDCVEPRALIPGATMTLRGDHLSGVRSVSLAGSEATVLKTDVDELVLRVGEPNHSGFLAGDVILRGASGTHMVAGGAAFTGAPFVRGDANGDGRVTREDWTQVCYQVHRNKPLACGATGDVDGDSDVDTADLSYLRGFISGTGPAPQGPYPTPGYVAGVLSCGLPDKPSITGVYDHNGDAITGAVSAGDVLEIEGTDLPPQHGATVYFGDVPTQVLADSTSDRLRVRIGAVPSSGSRCPVVWRGTSHRGRARYGQAFTVDQDDALCPTFASSNLRFAFTSHVERDTVVLSLPRESFPAGQTVDLDAAFHLPFVDGAMRGPRGVRKTLFLPPGDNAYAEGLQHLATELQKALQGESDDECECELMVLPNVVDQTLTIRPCGEPPPEPPTPTVPGLPTQVTPTRIIVGHLDLLSPEPAVSTFTCDDEVDYESDPLGWSWCEVAKVALPPENHEIDEFEQYPTFESLVPIQVSLDANYEPWVLTPALKPASQKNVLVDHAVDVGLNMYGYDNGCDMALRHDRCSVFTDSWTPRFSKGGRVVKLFWIGQSKVPVGLDVSGLYNWVPANDHDPNTLEERQYLVGMHVNVAANEEYGTNGYFRWITAWLPLPPNVNSPHYNPTCSPGDETKRPVSLQGTPFKDFVLCNPKVAGQSSCGNPWATLDECSTELAQGCTNCHRPMGRVGAISLETAWLNAIPKYKGSDIVACDDAIDANPNYAPDWGGAPLMSTPPSWQPICEEGYVTSNIPWKCHFSNNHCTETPGYP